MGLPGRLTEEEVVAIGDMRRALESANPQDKAEVYSPIGLCLTYEVAHNAVIAQAQPGRSCMNLCVRGVSATGRTWPTAMPGPIHRIRVA